jgi:PPOX class probable F420-dependent enzyme
MSSAKRFSAEKYVSLETYKRSGDAVQTPVWIVEEGGVLYVRTDPGSWKAKRIRRNPRVRVAPSDLRGKATGPWAEGEARFIEGPEADRVLRLIKEKYGATGKLVDSFNRLRGMHPTAVISIKLN